jgi:hypothetical protein
MLLQVLPALLCAACATCVSAAKLAVSWQAVYLAEPLPAHVLLHVLCQLQNTSSKCLSSCLTCTTVSWPRSLSTSAWYLAGANT